MTRPLEFYRAPVLDGAPAPARPAPGWRERMRCHPFDVAEAWLRQIPGPHVLLDVGCSRLDLLRRCAVTGSRRFGMDLAIFPEWKANGEIHTVAADADERAFPFKSQQFTAVTAMMVLEHVFDPFHFLHETHRVLGPGGVVILQVPNLGFLRHRLDLACGRLPVTSSHVSWREIGWDGAHLHYFTKARLAWLLAECGLTAIRWAGSGLLAPVRRWRPSLLFADLIVMARKLASAGTSAD